MTPEVLLILHSGADGSAEMLRGIVQYQRSRQSWRVSLLGEAKSEMGPCWVRSKKWHGVISRDTTPELLEACAQGHTPIVDLGDTPPSAAIPKVRPDNIAIGCAGARYLMARQFQRYWFCGFSNRTWSTERMEGFLQTLGKGMRRGEVFNVEQPQEFTPTWLTQQSALLGAWLRCLPAGSAVMACDDDRAQAIVGAALAAGLRVPHDVAVLGVSHNETRCELAVPSISSVGVNACEAGRLAAEHLDRLIRGEATAPIDVRVEPLGVVTRQSTDVLGARDEHMATALSYIREHACEGIKVEEVLRKVPISRTQLESKMRRYIGASPQVEIRRVQVARIRELLSDTKLSLKEIAQRTGFVHVEYMCVVFKRLTGETLGQFRYKNVQPYHSPQAMTSPSVSLSY